MTLPQLLRQALCCLLCNAEVAHLDTLPTVPVSHRLVRRDGSGAPLPRRGGLPRCPHCGGSLYLQEAERITIWPTVRIGREKPGRKPRVPREAA
jgi:hypothetical protein